MRTTTEIKADIEAKMKQLDAGRKAIENLADQISKLQLELFNLELGEENLNTYKSSNFSKEIKNGST